ncbi:hypothetical protein AV540_01500 [Brevibacillus parabrevis]|nr:hypothetical protein AV540_01500 [Brevibacillus parabrevis]HBZ82705.1 hypothetical protein [Brevibacillus sp.]
MMKTISPFKLILFLVPVLLVVILIISINTSSKEKYVKIFESNDPAVINELSQHKFRYIIEKDGSVWIHEEDQYKYAMCCT